MLCKVAVTGGLSCGKSSACHLFKELGAHVVSADAIVHKLLSPITPLGKQIIALLGDDIVVNDQIDRGLVAKKVFNNQLVLNSLQKIIHPAVLDEIDKSYRELSIQNESGLFIAEVPLLFEIGAEKLFEWTIVISAPEQECRDRFKKSTGYDDAEFDRRMAQQMPTQYKIKLADFVIENNNNKEALGLAIKKIYNKLVSSTI